MLQADERAELHHGTAKATVELPFQLALRQAEAAGDLGDGQRVGNVRFDQGDGLLQDGRELVGPLPQRAALRGGGGAEALVEDLVGDLARHAVAVLVSDQAQHQVDAGHAACAGHHAVA